MELSLSQVGLKGWKPVQKLGGGTFGTVYEIERNFSGETEKAALKIISVPTDVDEAKKLISEGYDIDSINKSYRSEVDDIYKEYMLMAKLKGNSNIVYCDDILGPVPGEEGIGWVLCIKMELLTPLKKAFNADNAEEQAIKVGIDLCNALVACQKHNIIHRDIKPENIMVSADGTYKLGDFGIAKTASGTASGTKTGTYSYMAPEVYNNKPYGISADIYSVGMVLYWMLNGRSGPYLQPFPYKPTANEIEMANQRRFSGEALPAPTNGSTQLKNIVLKALAFNPNQRFASPADFRQALMNLNTAESMEYNILYVTYEQTHSGWDQENRTQGNSWDETYAGTQGSVGTDSSKSTFGTMGAENLGKAELDKFDVRTFLFIDSEEAANGCKKTVVISELNKKVFVTVPAGIQDNEVLKLNGAGKEDPTTGKKGTVFVHIKLESDIPNQIWGKNNQDCDLTLYITEKEYKKGTERYVISKTTGRKTRIVIDAGVKSGQILERAFIENDGKARLVRIRIMHALVKYKIKPQCPWSTMPEPVLGEYLIHGKGAKTNIILSVIMAIISLSFTIIIPPIFVGSLGMAALFGWCVWINVRCKKNYQFAKEEVERRAKQRV